MLTAAGEAPADSQALSGILLCGTNVSARVVAQGTWFRPERYRHRRASGREIWRRSAWHTRPPGRQTAQCRRPTRPATGRTCATSSWSATPERARPRWSRRCWSPPGTIHRAGRVEDGTTVSDHDEAELRQQRSVNLALAPLTHQGVKVNLLDTPGYADFVGDLRAGLRAADCALFVVSAAEPIDGSTRMLWAECAAVGMPRAVVLTKLDHARSDYAATLAACQEAFGANVLPLYLPVVDSAGATTGLIGMLSGRLFDYGGGTRQESDASPDDADRLEAARGELIEGIIEESEDEGLMDRYLGGEEIEQKVLIDDLEQAVAKGSFHPVIPVCATTGLGTAELLEIVTSAFPSPIEHPMPEVTSIDGKPRSRISCDPAGPLVAEIVKTTTDAYVGRISLVRVFSGTLRPDQTVHVSGHCSGRPRSRGTRRGRAHRRGDLATG